MTDKEEPKKKVLSLGGTKPKLELKKPVSTESAGSGGSVRQSFSHGRTKTVAVEVKRKRFEATPSASQPARLEEAHKNEAARGRSGSAVAHGLTQDERDARIRALRGAVLENEQRRQNQPTEEELETEMPVSAEGTETVAVEEEPDLSHLSPRERLRQKELDELKRIQAQEKTENEKKKKEEDERVRAFASNNAARASEGEEERKGTSRAPQTATERAQALMRRVGVAFEEEDAGARGKRTVPGAGVKRSPTDRRREGKMTITQALSDEDGDTGGRRRSLASIRRRIEREKRQNQQQQEQVKVTRDVIVPEVITVQELSNRMAERAADVIKCLMKMGVMATITQSIDADTAELVVSEFGHRVKRVAESDIETNLTLIEDSPENMQARPPVVTVMGHVDHGKTSLLDALRKTDVVAGEAGGITQHIGAYQILFPEPQHGFDRVTFIDTPGHAAFTEMRARGANVTDIVVLVVAADDGVMPQTIEAIRHAKAAGAPIVVAINKCDLPGAKPERIRQELLQYDIQVEEMGGEVLSVEISAKKRIGLDKLLDAILLQAEILDLKANPDRPAEGAVVEAKLEKGRGSVATVLVQRGTLKIGDIFVVGSEWGRVRALMNERGANVTAATPAMPVEVIGLNGTPTAGDELMVVPTEARAREISEFRQRRRRSLAAAANKRGTLEQMLENIKAGAVKEFPVVIKGDVHGSVEAIRTSLVKLAEDSTEVKVQILDSAVGAITESDVTLANASKAMIIGFNVRANPQAREMARRDGVEIRYYSIIYNVIDEVKKALSGLLSPDLKEKFLGNAQILQVFNITRVGKIAGCKISEGMVKRGAKVRLLRDNVVIHEGTLKTLKRMKDEVKEVREGYECGMAFENYDNIQEGDVIECFEIEEIAREM